MNKYFPILAIETSGELCSVAVMMNENSYAETSIQQKHVHSQKLIDLINSTLVNIDLKISDIKLIAVSEGPGSFTGLRIGYAAAKGIAFAGNIPIVPVPSIDALAFQISTLLPENTVFNIANNVNAEELYFAKYISSKTGFELIGELQIINKDELSSMIGTGEPVYGTFNQSAKLIKITSPDAKYVAFWAYLFGSEMVTPDYDLSEPNYLKKFVVRTKKC